MDKKAIKKFLDSGTGQATKDYLLGQLAELRDIDNVDEKDTPTHQALEVKAQKRAYNKLKDILSEIMTIPDENEEIDIRDSFII